MSRLVRSSGLATGRLVHHRHDGISQLSNRKLETNLRMLCQGRRPVGAPAHSDVRRPLASIRVEATPADLTSNRNFEASKLQFPEEFCSPMKVRAFEIDQYCVVNNAVYIQYLQHVRHELLEFVGMEDNAEIGGYALSELNVKYRSPLRQRDRFLATASITRMTRVRATFSQRLIRLHPSDEDKDEVVVEAEAVVVVLDDDYKPMKAPTTWTTALKPYIRT